MKRTWLRAPAGLCVWLLLAGLGSLAPLPSWAGVNCGGAGQRACCVLEQLPSCNPGFFEVGGCEGDCKCGGVNPFGLANAIGHCESIADCGGPGQRACCVMERPGRPCNPGNLELPGCSGNCVCGGPNPGYSLNSISHCFAIAACGGPGQRACCVTERPGRPCDPGAVEIGGCSGNCMCGGPAPNPGGLVKSITSCIAVSACGGPGQRACCVTERPGRPCDPGSIEIGGCSGNCTCGGPAPNPGGLVKSITHCIAVTACGGNGQRACCVTERPGSPCNQGLNEIGGCSGDCRCGGANPGGALNSIGRCAPPPATPQQPVTTLQPGTMQPPITMQPPGTTQPPAPSCQSALAALNAANQAVQQLCGPASGAQKGSPTTNQNVGGPGGLPAKSGSPGSLQRPLSPPAAPGGLQRPITR